MKKKQKQKWKHIGLILSILLLNVNGKTWRDFPKHYKSLIYASSVNTVYYFICRRHLLWEFTPVNFNWKLLRLIHEVVVTPLLILLYLSKYPNSLVNRIRHIIKWVLGTSIVEFTAHKQKLIQYKHGWNIFWSGLLYLKMFIYSSLFTKRPFLTSILSVCSIIFFVIKFKVPIKSKHLFSRKLGTLVDSFYHSFLEDVF